MLYLFILSVILSSCTNKLNYSLDKNEIVSIEIIEFESYQQDLIYNILYVLDDNEISNFIEDLSQIDFSKVYGDPYGFSGKCILIQYSNNDYEIIGQKYIERRNINNEVLTWHYYHADEIQFAELISKYNQA